MPNFLLFRWTIQLTKESSVLTRPRHCRIPTVSKQNNDTLRSSMIPITSIYDWMGVLTHKPMSSIISENTRAWIVNCLPNYFVHEYLCVYLWKTETNNKVAVKWRTWQSRNTSRSREAEANKVPAIVENKISLYMALVRWG